jgi:hypothetical protein
MCKTIQLTGVSVFIVIITIILVVGRRTWVRGQDGSQLVAQLGD